MRFLKGLFTEHIATKFMALLLAVVLFVFVQQSLQGEQKIEVLMLEFELTPSLRNEYAVVTPSIRVDDMTIKGLNTKVDLLKEQFGRNKTQTIEIDQEFLRAYAVVSNIPVDQAFLLEHNVLPRGIEVDPPLPKLRLRVEPLRERTLELTLARGMAARTHLSDDTDYEGTLDGGKQVEIEFSTRIVKVRAPASALTGESGKLYVQIGKVDDYLRHQYSLATGGPSMEIAGFNWVQSGINSALFAAHARFLVGSEWVRLDEFQKRLRATFAVKDRKTKGEVSLRVRFMVTVEGLTILEGFKHEGPEGLVGYSKLDMQQGICEEIHVRYSSFLKADALQSLILVLDVAHFKRSGENIVVPIYLDVDDPDRGDLLRQVEIQMLEGRDGETPYVRFQPDKR